MADTYRANRQLERIFGYKGPDHVPIPQLISSEECGELVAIITYDFNNKKVRVERVN